MPDPSRQTISASQMPALFGASPYLTRFMLFHHFRNGAPLDQRENIRMRWGTLQQEAILAGTADAYRLAIQSNVEAREYVRRGQIGHTRDGLMHAADVGPIVVEAKNVDYFVHRDSWTDTAAPAHIEIQLQTGMYCDNAERGIIAHLVGGNDLRFFERSPDRDFQQRMLLETADFFESVAQNREPEPLGSPIELPMFAHLYPAVEPDRILEALDNKEWRELFREFRYCRDQESFYKSRKEQLRPKVEAIIKTNSLVRLNSLECKVTKVQQPESLVIKDEVLGVARDMLKFFEGKAEPIQPIEDIRAVLANPYRIQRKGSVQTRFRFFERPGDPPLEGDDVLQMGGKDGLRV